MILIISNKWDVTVDFVVLELQKRKHSYVRLNTEDLVSNRVLINAPDISITFENERHRIDLVRDVGAVWNRRPGFPFDEISKTDRPSQGVQLFITDQWRMLRYGLTAAADIAWVNPPDAELRAESKVHQLVLARKLGFAVPETLFTNDPDAIRAFASRRDGRVIAKAMYTPLIEEEDQDRFIFTSKLEMPCAKDDASIALCPFIVQERITPKTDYRVTVIGDVVIAARIESNSGRSVDLDWRTQKDGLSFVECKLPPRIAALCNSYVKASGLFFGAIDLVERDDTFFFLEINPNGEWGWLQKPMGLPIAERLCDLLVSLDRRNPNER
ncbi:MAG: hypothetical protein DME97_02870 [Verrucomicrobia bacterium]|nr:MAG: hypothetical protein DME97_02870 [Verrucomicrobiota bacterium]